MKISLKQLLDSEIPYQARIVSKLETKSQNNFLGKGITYEETQKMNTYDTVEVLDDYYKHVGRLGTLRVIQAENSLEQMVLIKKQEALKSMIAFLKSFIFPMKKYDTTKTENNSVFITENQQYYHEEVNPNTFDERIELMEVEISNLQRQINRLNSEMFVEIPDRI